MRLASVRRSLFTGEAERSAFLNRLVAGTRDVLRGNRGLAEHGNYHEFCRLLGRLKTNYQLSELVGTPPPLSPYPPGLRSRAPSERGAARASICVAVLAVWTNACCARALHSSVARSHAEAQSPARPA